MSRPSIAIIGAGFSGTTLATQILANTQHAPPALFLIDSSGRFGPGFAYGTKHPAHLMNVRAGRLSVVPQAPSDFSAWLAARGRDDASQFAQRANYGAYLESTLRGAARASEPGTLNLVRDAAIACHPSASGVEIELRSGRRLSVDAAVLALGNQKAALPAPFDRTPELADNVIDAWDEALGNIPAHDDILLLGSGLTMVDAMLRLAATPRQGKVYALSRHGLAPRAHSDRHPHDLAPLMLDGELSSMLAATRREVRATLARGGVWQDVFERLRPQTVATWIALSSLQKARFLRHLRPYWDVHRHRTAPHLHAWLAAMRGLGALEVIAARIAEVTRVEDGFQVRYQPRGAKVRTDLKVAHIVNCTGVCADLSKSSDALVQQLLHSGVARAHETALGFDVEINGRVIATHGRAHARLYALGPLAQGAFWETTAIPEIRSNAAAMANTLVGSMQIRTASEAALSRTNSPRRRQPRAHANPGVAHHCRHPSPHPR